LYSREVQYLTQEGKKGVCLNRLRAVQRRKEPKKRMAEKKKMSATYWHDSPLRLPPSLSNKMRSTSKLCIPTLSHTSDLNRSLLESKNTTSFAGGYI
jgi:hypothetical protein